MQNQNQKDMKFEIPFLIGLMFAALMIAATCNEEQVVPTDETMVGIDVTGVDDKWNEYIKEGDTLANPVYRQIYRMPGVELENSTCDTMDCLRIYAYADADTWNTSSEVSGELGFVQFKTNDYVIKDTFLLSQTMVKSISTSTTNIVNSLIDYDHTMIFDNSDVLNDTLVHIDLLYRQIDTMLPEYVTFGFGVWLLKTNGQFKYLDYNLEIE